MNQAPTSGALHSCAALPSRCTAPGSSVARWFTLPMVICSLMAGIGLAHAQTPAPRATTQTGTQPVTPPSASPATQPAATQVTQPAVGPAFSTLSPYQAEVLKPLQPVWDELGEVRKRKWIEIANRMPTLSDDEKQRVQQRMQEWAALTPAQRRQVRDNFTEAMSRTAAQRQAQWEEYQKLSPEARQALAERAQLELRQKREAAVANGPVGAAATTRPATKPSPTTTAPSEPK